MPEIILNQYALTTVDDVKEAAGIADDDPVMENNIRRVINAIGVSVWQQAQIEFKMPLSQATAFDGAMTAGSAILTSATGTFAAGDVGKTIVVYGAGVQGPTGKLESTILSRQSASQVTLANAAVNTVSGAQYVYGSVTRTVQMTGDGYGNGRLDFSPYTAQAISAALIDTQGGSAGTSLNPAAFDYQANPMAEPYGVYNSATVYSWGSQQFSLITPWSVQRQATLTGLWGYPQVPADVKEAVEQECATRLNALYRIVTNSPISGDFAEPAGSGRPLRMSLALLEVVNRYARLTVVG